MKLETLEPRWDGPIIVAAPGPSLDEETVEACQHYPTIAIKQSGLLLRHAAVVYACNSWQWDLWGGFPDFEGERWSLHHKLDRKDWIADKYGLRLVRGDGIRAERFSTDPSIVHYGNCSGFAALGFAIHWLVKPGRIIMIGFDFRDFHGRRYFNGQHPRGHGGGQYHAYMPMFEQAAKHLPDGIEIVNATPKSALRCFPSMPLTDALEGKEPS